MTNPLIPPADHKPEPEAALPERLARAIALAGPIPVAQFMAASLALAAVIHFILALFKPVGPSHAMVEHQEAHHD